MERAHQSKFIAEILQFTCCVWSLFFKPEWWLSAIFAVSTRKIITSCWWLYSLDVWLVAEEWIKVLCVVDVFKYRSNLFFADPKASGQHIKRKLVSFVDQCHCLTQSDVLDACLCCFFVCLFTHFFAPVCIVQAYACLLVVSSLLTGRRQKSILIRYFSKMKKSLKKLQYSVCHVKAIQSAKN